jgi:uncharacterized metal-binding protein YceD (DUF177 family)
MGVMFLVMYGEILIYHQGKMNLIVRFGEEFNDDNEELLILPFGEFEINVSQYIYEMIVLSVPLRRVHPGVKTEV